eukprot:1010986-Prymnesium_polylepis.2
MSRHFSVQAGGLLSLQGITLLNGRVNLLDSDTSLSSGWESTSTITGAMMSNEGGSLAVKGGTVHLTRCTISNSTTTERGGAVFVENAEAQFIGCVFNHSSVYHDTGMIVNFIIGEAYVYGGVLFADRAEVSLESCNISNSLAGSRSGSCRGGAIYVDEQCVVRISRCLFSNSSCHTEGGFYAQGGFMYVRDGSRVHLDRCRIVQSRAGSFSMSVFRRAAGCCASRTAW